MAVIVVQETIQHARSTTNSLDITWFDLADAFGSVPHVLIPYVLEHYHFPKQVIAYVTSLYSKLKGIVCTKKWKSELFKFLKGVFQGDPFSGIIFLTVFNPLIEYLKTHKETHGYDLKLKDKPATYVVTTPFADDFNVITRDNTQHQNLVSNVEQKLKTMGLVIKPQKCRSLSIQNGKTVNIQFQIHDNVGNPVKIASVIEKPLKFLGSEVTADNTPNAMFAFICSKLKEKLKNIGNSSLRAEYKLNIFSRYTLPSMRYYLSVHQLHKTHMNDLDDIVRKNIKSWLNIQTRGVSDVALYHPYMLGTKLPSQMYTEAHAGTYAMIRVKGDPLVNHALDSKLERESAWTRKHSTVSNMQQMWNKNLKENKVDKPSQDITHIEKRKQLIKGKKAMKNSIKEETLNIWNTKVKKLTFQGKFVDLVIEEQENITWKSILNNTPKGILSFAMKASVNGLNTPDNLKRWGKRQLDKCGICGNRSDLEHILNWCPVALKQGRMTWRHDSIISHMTKTIKKSKPSDIDIYSDLPGHKMNGGTIPPDILATSSRPDVVIVDRSSKEIHLLELTCSFEKNIETAHILKSRRYNDLK